MIKINAEYSAEHYFAALKLIEQLYKDGLISAQMLRSILNDHAKKHKFDMILTREV